MSLYTKKYTTLRSKNDVAKIVRTSPELALFALEMFNAGIDYVDVNEEYQEVIGRNEYDQYNNNLFFEIRPFNNEFMFEASIDNPAVHSFYVFNTTINEKTLDKISHGIVYATSGNAAGMFDEYIKAEISK